ncbi:unnamed protein product [Calicophoron daubneyi]|uniref:Coiled-coil domain-containing protein 112-like n=1 Tax=Calicophoron daubneyi TaxID=300641 RepID=A0AAV2SXM6_CALDB
MRENGKSTDSAENRILEMKFRQLFRECLQSLSKLCSTDSSISDVVDLHGLLQKAFKADGRKYFEKLTKARTLLESFKIRTAEFSEDPASVVDAKELIRKLEFTLSEYKKEENITAEALLREEVNLWQECLFDEKKISCWIDEDENGARRTECVKDSGGSKCGHLRIDVKEDLPQEITAFQQFLDSTGGRLGGWKQEEHSTFLRLYKHYQNRKSGGSKQSLASKQTQISPATTACQEKDHPQSESTANDIKSSELLTSADEKDDQTNRFHEETALALCTKTPQQVRDHEQWWVRLQKLDTDRRQAIQRWRESKKNFGSHPELVKVDPTKKSESLKYSFPTVDELKAHREALDKWRLEREENAKRLTQAKKEAMDAAKEAEREQIRKRQAELKEKVNRYKSAKEAGHLVLARCLAVQAEQERLVRQQRVRESAGRIEQRNQRILEERISRKGAIKQAEEEKIARLRRAANSNSVVVTRDPNRVIRWTKGWEMRMATAEDRSAHINQGYTPGCTPKRMIPNWRKGI